MKKKDEQEYAKNALIEKLLAFIDENKVQEHLHIFHIRTI